MQKMMDLLELPSYTYPIFGMCIGYPDPERLPDRKPRSSLDDILHYDRYDQEKTERSIREYDQIMKTYYEHRDSNNQIQTWSERVLQQYSGPRRTSVKQCLIEQKFTLN